MKNKHKVNINPKHKERLASLAVITRSWNGVVAISAEFLFEARWVRLFFFAGLFACVLACLRDGPLTSEFALSC